MNVYMTIGPLVLLWPSLGLHMIKLLRLQILGICCYHHCFKMSSALILSEMKSFRFDTVMRDLVHDMRVIHGLCELHSAS